MSATLADSLETHLKEMVKINALEAKMSWLDALRPTFPMIQRNCSFLKHSQRVGNNQKYDFPVSKKKKSH